MSDYSDLKSLANNYRESIADSKNLDMFSLGYQWADKPHRHVYDLCKKLEEAADAIESLESERDALLPWKMFYADGQSLGEIAKHFDKSIYDFSPWLTAPAARIALEAIETKTARIMELLVENAHLRRKLNSFGVPQYGEPGGPI